MDMKRIQRRRTKGWRMPEGAVYVGRPSRWGNPFGMGDGGNWTSLARRTVTGNFRSWLVGKHWSGWSGPASEARRAKILDRISDLRGHDLACWCPLDQPCHADVLLELAND